MYKLNYINTRLKDKLLTVTLSLSCQRKSL